MARMKDGDFKVLTKPLTLRCDKIAWGLTIKKRLGADKPFLEIIRLKPKDDGKLVLDLVFGKAHRINVGLDEAAPLADKIKEALKEYQAIKL